MRVGHENSVDLQEGLNTLAPIIQLDMWLAVGYAHNVEPKGDTQAPFALSLPTSLWYRHPKKLHSLKYS